MVTAEIVINDSLFEEVAAQLASLVDTYQKSELPKASLDTKRVQQLLKDQRFLQKRPVISSNST